MKMELGSCGPAREWGPWKIVGKKREKQRVTWKCTIRMLKNEKKKNVVNYKRETNNTDK